MRFKAEPSASVIYIIKMKTRRVTSISGCFEGEDIKVKMGTVSLYWQQSGGRQSLTSQTAEKRQCRSPASLGFHLLQLVFRPFHHHSCPRSAAKKGNANSVCAVQIRF